LTNKCVPVSIFLAFVDYVTAKKAKAKAKKAVKTAKKA
jgi:hypothetical protein